MTAPLEPMEPPGATAVTASAPAKVNLHLGVGPLGRDGYHPLVTVFHALDLRDRVTVSPSSDWAVEVRAARRDEDGDQGGGDDGEPSDHSAVDVSGVPLGEDNVALRAARLLAARAGATEAETGPVRVRIEKGIPVAAGMAGGSADAAATLVACDALWQLGTPREELETLAAQLGSDVTFALVGGTALGAGRGDEVAPVLAHGELWWVLVLSDAGLATPAVYRAFDDAGTSAPDAMAAPEELLVALRDHDVHAVGAALRNDLQAPAVGLRPELGEVLARGREAGALASLVSGSGPTCAMLCTGGQHARDVAAGLAGLVAAPGSAARGTDGPDGPRGRVRVARGPVAGARLEAG